MKKDVEMPDDWNNHFGWESYFSSIYPNGDFVDRCFWIGSIGLDRVESLASELQGNGYSKIWFPGCGISLLPKALAQRGFDVFATDISQTAINFQSSDNPRIQELIDKQVKSEIQESGKLTAALHDFREPLKFKEFDLVINTKAFQGFDKQTMSKVAKTHFDSLRGSRNAIFDTTNVQGELRETLEASLIEAGFLIPFYDLHRWYRTKLNETGIPYVFVLGSPFIPRFGEYSNDEEKVEAHTKILRDISEEFRNLQNETLETEQARLTAPNVKIASIIYSTG